MEGEMIEWASKGCEEREGKKERKKERRRWPWCRRGGLGYLIYANGSVAQEDFWNAWAT